MASERLQKILAQAGVASRRAAERLISDGHVRVNGRIVTELGSRANLNKDRVEVDGKRLVAEKLVYYLMHKPREVMTTLHDPEGRKNISDLVKEIPARVFPVGRLDFQTSGALLLTNDGELAQALLHPKRAVPKIYSVKLQGRLDERGLTALREGVVLDDGQKTAPALVSMNRFDERHTFLDITITEGKNRQIHRMAEAIGRRVLRLTRISFAGLSLEELRPGQMRPLLPSELTELKQKYMGIGKRDAARRQRASNDFAESGMFDAGEASFQLDDDEEDMREVPVVERTPARARAQRPQRTAAEKATGRAAHAARTIAGRTQNAARNTQARGPERIVGERMPPARKRTRGGRKSGRSALPERGQAIRVEVSRAKLEAAAADPRNTTPVRGPKRGTAKPPARTPVRGKPDRNPRRNGR